MKKNTIYKALYIFEIVTGLVASSTVTILMNVWAFRTLFSMNSGYDNIAQRIVAAMIMIAATAVWAIGTNPNSIVCSAKKRYRNRVRY